MFFQGDSPDAPSVWSKAESDVMLVVTRGGLSLELIMQENKNRNLMNWNEDGGLVQPSKVSSPAWEWRQVSFAAERGHCGLEVVHTTNSHYLTRHS